MTQITTLTQKGQVTIPLFIRTFLNLKPYQKVAFELRNNEVIIKKYPDLLSLKGSIKTNKKYSDNDSNKAVSAYVKKEYEEKQKRTA